VTRLWDFAVEIYGAPGVADACLALQDGHGCDVNIILFAAWMGAVRHERLSPADMADVNSTVQRWQDEIVRPLRTMRRRLKSGPPPAPGAMAEELRARIKAAELESERIELLQLEELAGKRASPSNDPALASMENLATSVRQFKDGELNSTAMQLIDIIQSAVARLATASTS
jgi:uncharacterized protein (TIGR02444 family)